MQRIVRKTGAFISIASFAMLTMMQWLHSPLHHLVHPHSHHETASASEHEHAGCSFHSHHHSKTSDSTEQESPEHPHHQHSDDVCHICSIVAQQATLLIQQAALTGEIHVDKTLVLQATVSYDFSDRTFLIRGPPQRPVA